MRDNDLSRRNVLRGLAAGGTATGIAGQTIARDGLDRTIVGLTANASFEVAREAADEVVHELDFGVIGKAVAGPFPEATVEALAEKPTVRCVEADLPGQAHEQTLPRGIDRGDADVLHEEGATGNGGPVAIIDTGIQADHEDRTITGGENFGPSCSDCRKR